MKHGECRGAKPLCRESEGVPQNKNFFPFVARKGAREPALSIVEGDGRKSFSAPCEGLGPGYIWSGASMLMSERERASTILAASTSFNRALVIAASSGSLDTTLHCW